MSDTQQSEYKNVVLLIDDETANIIALTNILSPEYEVFAARVTDIADPAYRLDFSAPGSFEAFAGICGAPPGTAQILTLSTCLSGDNDDERVIVQGALRLIDE